MSGLDIKKESWPFGGAIVQKMICASTEQERYPVMNIIIRLLLFILLTLAWVPWGEAGDDKPNTITICASPNGGYFSPNERCNSKPDRATPLTKEPDPCLAKMEAAMRAMEPFIMKTFQDKSEAERRIKELVQAEVLWDAAKRACWKEPR